MAMAKPCEGCGVLIEFHPSPNGKPMPVQRVKNIYGMGSEGRLVRVTAIEVNTDVDLGPVFVSHFETCPRANDFSGRGRKA